MKLTVRAVTRNWVDMSSRRTADAKVEFCVDSDTDGLTDDVKAAVSAAEKDISLRLMLETVEGGGCDEASGISLSHVIGEFLIEKGGCPKLAEMFCDNACVPYVEFEWNGWTTVGFNHPMRFAEKPWSKLHWNTRKKVLADEKDFVPGTALVGALGKKIMYGEPVSRYTLDGKLKTAVGRPR